jgi:hypothetical protein
MAELLYPGWISGVGPVAELAPQIDGATVVNGGGEVIDRSPEDIVAFIQGGRNWMDYCAWPLYYQGYEALFGDGFARLLRAFGVNIEPYAGYGVLDFWGPGEGVAVDEQGREVRYLNVYSPIILPEGLTFRVNGIYHTAIPAGSHSYFALETSAGGYYYASWNIPVDDYVALGVSLGHEVEWSRLMPQLFGGIAAIAVLGMVGSMMVKSIKEES